MADNPYCFTVTIEHSSDGFIDVWVRGTTHVFCRTEAEANAHADMILTALQGATRE